MSLNNGTSPQDSQAALAGANKRINDLMPAVTADPAAARAPEFIDAAAIISILDPQEYERLRRRLKGMQVGVTRWESDVTARAIARKREQEEATAQASAGGGQASIVPARPAPWHQPIDLEELLNDLADYLKRFLRLDDHARVAVVLWIAFTYVLDAAQYSPRLAMISPMPRCGKSTLVELLDLLCPQAITTSSITSAAVVRLTGQQACTILMDEGDTYANYDRELKGIINSGHKRALAHVMRLVPGGPDGWHLARFSTWAAVAYAAIGKLSDTWMDRSIEVRLRRMKPDEQVENLADAQPSEAQDLASKLSRFADDHLDALRQARPAQPSGLDHRAMNNWVLLFAIADLAAGDWPAKAREAALALSGGRQDDDEDFPKVQLLSDIQAVFGKDKQDIGSTALCDRLNALLDSPWSAINRGSKLKPAKLARTLREFDIYPRQRGSGSYYDAKDFADAFLCYVPEPLPEPATVPQLHGGVGERPSGEVPQTGSIENASSSTGRGANGTMAS